jgi:hypothetical protein
MYVIIRRLAAAQKPKVIDLYKFFLACSRFDQLYLNAQKRSGFSACAVCSPQRYPQGLWKTRRL